MDYHHPCMADESEPTLPQASGDADLPLPVDAKTDGADAAPSLATDAAPDQAIQSQQSGEYHHDYVPYHEQLLPDATKEELLGPLPRATLAYVAGLLAAPLIPWVALWLLAAVIAGAMRLFLSHRTRSAALCGYLAIASVGGAWLLAREQYVSSDHLIHYLTSEPQLARVTATIDSPVAVTRTQRGPFASFAFEPPSTTFTVDVQSIVANGIEQPTQGKLIAKLRQAETRLHQGDRVIITGWMQLIDGPSNPGEFDYRQVCKDRGIHGRITMSVRGNCQRIESGSSWTHLGMLRQQIADGCSQSLRKGMQNDPVRLAFLDTLLLGRWSRDLDELSESFRKTGLTHTLSISGAHLTILMLLVWAVVRLFISHPSRAAIVVLTVLILYMMAVPWRAPIVRAGVMAGLVCIGAASGRRVRAIDMVALSALIIFTWRPADVFNAGAQLSYGVVAGLLVFTPRVSRWIRPDPLIVSPVDETRTRIERRVCDYLAMNLVAFLIALPLVAYHFQWVSPLAMLLSILAIPVITAAIGLGYMKMLIGLIVPSIGAMLAGPLEWIADSMTSLVTHAATWPASSVALGSSPSAVWLVTTLAVVCAAMAGVFAMRRKLLVLLATACIAWLALFHHPLAAAILEPFKHKSAMQVNMFAVGDGSCFLVQLAGTEENSPHTLMFDCGSLGFLDVGSRSIVPALRQNNITRIDTLFLSHADLDHFCGVIDLVNYISVKRVLMPPQMLREAEDDARSAAALLVDHLHDKRIPIEAISRGWSASLGNAQATVHWPPADFTSDRANSTSLVLSLHAANRRLMLSGDIDQIAIPKLIETGDDLRADIADLPHHGSFVRASPQWFAAVAPTVVLQSSGPARLRTDLWADLLHDAKLTRLVTAKLGMVQVNVELDGAIGWKSFRSTPVVEVP